MKLENEAIERLKSEVDLVAVVEGEGVKLERRGGSHVGLCPFHDDKTPSFTVNPKTRLFHCFGCGEGGNAITFLMKKRGIGFREAFQALTDSGVKTEPVRELYAMPSEARRRALLAQVYDAYHATFQEHSDARHYLAERGLTDESVFQAYGVGYCNGTLASRLSLDADSVRDLKALGVLKKGGREHFYGCLVVPLYDADQSVVGLYGRKLRDGRVNHLYLPGSRRGLVSRAGARGHVVLCESVLDAMSVSSAGLSGLASYGTQGLLDEHIAQLSRPEVQSVTIAFDGDKAGHAGAQAASEALKKLSCPVRIVELPEGDDLNQILVRAGVPGIRAAVSLNPLGDGFERTETGFFYRVSGRQYEVKGISTSSTQLKVTLRVSRINDSDRFELSTIDLYSHRSRSSFAELCARLFEVELEVARGDLARILEHAERKEPESAPQIEVTALERDAAQAFLEAPNLLGRLEEDFERMGYTGERNNKLLGYIAATSRLLEEPLSVLIQSRSAAGKSALQDAILKLIPDDEVRAYSRLTDQALFYQREDALKHKILAIEEAEGMGGAAYSIRAMQSQKRLTVAATGQDPATGKLLTQEYAVSGPVCVMLTTTRTDFDPETQSRFLCLSVDESPEATERIHTLQRERDTLEGLLKRKSAERIERCHQVAQGFLEVVHVVNPLAPKLAFPTHSLKARRDHQKYLSLIKAIAFLHQKQREVHIADHEGESIRYIEATEADVLSAHRLAGGVFRQSLQDLSGPGQRLLEQVRAYVRTQKGDRESLVFTRRLLREFTGWSDWQVKTHLAELCELEYLEVCAGGGRGRQVHYALASSDALAPVGLLSSEELLVRLRGEDTKLAAKTGS